MKKILLIAILTVVSSGLLAICPGKEKRAETICPGKEKRFELNCPGKDK